MHPVASVPSGRVRVLFVLVARGGSRGLPRKNLLRLGGLSLVALKAIAARRSGVCSRLIVSSDDPEIQDEARRYGADVPFDRPAELATDGAPTSAVVLHAMSEVERARDGPYEAVMVLEPSSPFARPSDLADAVRLMREKSATLVVGVRRVDVSSVFVGPLDAEGRITAIIDKMRGLRDVRRQAFEPEYTPNGTFYLARWDALKRTGDLYHDRERSYGLVMPYEYSIEIDELRHYRYAEFLVDRGDIDLSPWAT
jgi:N-acylneuraminate cytidylyltransferase/CMP-N,N'-diacetyllegionaminic acid synthase